jgi:hypothetical protein
MGLARNSLAKKPGTNWHQSHSIMREGLCQHSRPSPMNLLRLLFSFSGRINRSECWFWYGIAYAAMVIATITYFYFSERKIRCAAGPKSD